MYKVFYLDDEKSDLIVPIVQKLESTGQLSIDWEKPITFENEIDKLEERLKDYNALFLDLQLNGDQEDGTKVKYQAPPLAQMIRTLATEKKITDLPIILCSTDDKIRDSFKRDFTSHDLFDWTFLKDEIDEKTINKVCAIARAYKFLNENPKDFSAILAREYSQVDDRILSRFINDETPPVHEIARVVFKDIVQPTGILINEQILAARLGIDIDESNDWAIIRDNFFAESKYNGIFSDGWSRWWSDTVNDLFIRVSNEQLTSLDAGERVEMLKKAFSVNIVAAKPLEFNTSTNYWTICSATKRPIDPFEGYKIDMKSEPKVWQDYAYVSFYALIERLAQKEGILMHPSEEQRFKIEFAELDS